MIVKALVLGTEHIQNRPGAEKKFDFHKVNFIDTENPSGVTCSCTLPSDGEQLKKLLPYFDQNRMKVCTLNIFLNDKYVNFGSVVAQ